MDQEKILFMILDKLGNIEREQHEIKNDIRDINKELVTVKEDIKDINKKLVTVKEDIKDINKELLTVKKDIKEMKSVQNTIQEFVLSTDKAIEVYEQDHAFIEKLKRVICEESHEDDYKA
ncbi:hypothetical protein [Abyssisolibacter fermentans]|uniref:hypothetical protein n=1 Tax=Abyssisolibacter fermentans TaxID=1766203 RepID=UPI00082EF9CA|nr:hypothetical protein [Abyssisolibacter fermentans]